MCKYAAQILCCLLVANCVVKQSANAIFFDEIFEYLLDGMSDSDESSEELTNTNLNVTCKNCTLTVACTNCTQSEKDVQSTLPTQIMTEGSLTLAAVTSSPPTPTNNAPERIVEINSNDIPAQNIQAESTPSAIPSQIPAVEAQPLAESSNGESAVSADQEKVTDETKAPVEATQNSDDDTSEKRFVCKMCSKAYTRSSNLIRHSRTHTDERPFVCEVCGKAFITSSDLLKHSRTHTGKE